MRKTFLRIGQTAAVAHGGEITILLAEDDEDDRVLTRAALHEAKHNAVLHTVGDGAELLEYLRRCGDEDSPRPNLILLDLNMPRMDGHEALAKIKQDPDLRSIPVVVLTTSTAQEDIASSYDLGANSYISKPTGFLSFVDTMRGFARYWTETVELPPVAFSG
jgi:CheY-like chemotaxis protein